jgi:hypothetical protein
MVSNHNVNSSGTNVVYTGFWRDWDRGKVLGATLTLKNENAAILVAALAVLVTLAGNRSWHICRLLWHSLLRSRETHKAIVKDHRRRQQVLLRNSETASGATVGLFQEWFAFGITKVLRECSPKDITLGMFVIGHAVLFIALGVLVSKIILGNTVVSKAVDTCGVWVPTIAADGNFTTESNLITEELWLNQTLNSESYVRSCYSNGGSQGILDCNRFATQSLPYRLYSDEACPFNSSVCLPDDTSAFRMVTDNITLSQLGMNGKYSNEIAIQRQSTCAVLNASLFLTEVCFLLT